MTWNFLMLERRMRAVKAAQRKYDVARQCALLTDDAYDDAYDKLAWNYVEACRGALVRCEARLARTINRCHWEGRVFKELYENKVFVENYETPERALLRFLLDGRE